MKGAKRIIPGFNLSMGFTLTYLSLIVLIPVGVVMLKVTNLGIDEFIKIITNNKNDKTLYETIISIFINDTYVKKLNKNIEQIFKLSFIYSPYFHIF